MAGMPGGVCLATLLVVVGLFVDGCDAYGYWTETGSMICRPRYPGREVPAQAVADKDACQLLCKNYVGAEPCSAAVFLSDTKMCTLYPGGCLTPFVFATDFNTNAVLHRAVCEEAFANDLPFSTVPGNTDCECESECEKASGCLYWQRQISKSECQLFNTDALGSKTQRGGDYRYGVKACHPSSQNMCPMPTPAPPTSIPLTPVPPTPIPATPIPPTPIPPTPVPSTPIPATPIPPTPVPLTPIPPTPVPPTPVPPIPPTPIPPTPVPPTPIPPTSVPGTPIPATPIPPTPIPPTSIPPTPVPPTPIPPTPLPPTPAPDTPIPPTPIPPTPAPDTPIPPTPIPPTPAPDTPVPPTPVPPTPIPPTPVPPTPAPDTLAPTPLPETPVPDTLVPTTIAPDTSIPSTLIPKTAFPTSEPTAIPTGSPDTDIPDTIDPILAVAKMTVAPAILRVDTTPDGAKGVSNVVVASSFLGSSLGGQRMALMLGTECGKDDDSSSDQLPFNLHPTRLSIGDTALAFHVGCVIGNLFVVIAGFTLLHLVMVYLVQWCGWVGRDTMQVQGIVKFPGVTMFLFLFLLQGTSLAASRLAFSGGPWSAVGAGTFVLCLMFIAYVYLILRDVDKKAVYHLDSTTSFKAAWFIGEGEWLSTSDSYIDRFGVMFRRFLPHASKFVIYDMCLSIGISLASAVKGNTLIECGHKRIAMAVMTVSYMILVLYVKPFEHKINNYTEAFGQALQTLGLIFIAFGFYSEDRSHWGFEAGMYTILLAMIFLLMKTVMDAVVFLYILKVARRPRLYAELRDHEEEMKEEPLIGHQESEGRMSDLSWKGLLSDLNLPNSSGSPPSPGGKQPPGRNLTWENLVSDVDSTSHTKADPDETARTNDPQAQSFTALPSRYGSVRLTEDGSMHRTMSRSRLGSGRMGASFSASPPVDRSDLSTTAPEDPKLTWDGLVDDVSSPQGGPNPSVKSPATPPPNIPPPARMMTSGSLGGVSLVQGEEETDSFSEAAAARRRSSNYTSVNLSPRMGPNYLPSRKARKKQMVVYT